MRGKKGAKIMRLRKGSNVEVFCTTKAIPGSWHPAQIVCCNGRSYSVQYDSVPSSPEDKINMEKVPRKMIRPIPPIDDKPVKWVPGDLIEVFVHGTWRVGKVICGAYGNNFIFVLPVGHARTIAVRICNVRRRRMWANNKWNLIKKDAVMVFDEFTKGMVVVPNKMMPHQSKSTGSSIGSYSANGNPYQFPLFHHWDDGDAESVNNIVVM